MKHLTRTTTLLVTALLPLLTGCPGPCGGARAVALQPDPAPRAVTAWVTDPTDPFGGVSRIVEQADGKLLLGGNRLRRLLSSGEDDPGFSPIEACPQCFALDRGDAILVAQGPTYPELGGKGFDLSRLTPQGSRDPSFAGHGEGAPAAVAFQPDGKVVVASCVARPFDGRECYGSCDETHAAISRFLADGTPDAGFGDGGKVVLVRPAQPTCLSSIAVDAGGIRVNLNLLETKATEILGPDGSPIDFATGGEVFAVPSETVATIAIPGGARLTIDSPRPDFGQSAKIVMTRTRADGSSDPTFGASGRVEVTADRLIGASTAAVLGDGTIVVAGVISPDGKAHAGCGRPETNWALFRFRPDGSEDDSLKPVTLSSGGQPVSAARASALRRDERLLPTPAK